MDKRTNIIVGAERVFEDQGFRGIGVDGILAPSGASTRTLYKHFGSRYGLVLAVLEKRHRDFMARLEGWCDLDDPVGNLFDVQEQWLIEHGARGCMLLRARGEFGGTNKEIVALVQRQKQEFKCEISKRVEAVRGRADSELTTQIWLLFEGATATASVSDHSILKSAKRAAAVLLNLAAR